MKVSHLLLSISVLFTPFIQSCGQQKNTDSAAVEEAFELLIHDKNFNQELALEEEDQFNGENHPYRQIFGDIDGDGHSDVLLRFTIEGRGGGNNWDAHYALFLYKNISWQYHSQIDAGSQKSERIIQFTEINEGKIIGHLVSNDDNTSTQIPVEFIFKNNQLINIYTRLHKDTFSIYPYMYVNKVFTNEFLEIPIYGNLKQYQNLLEKGTIKNPEEQPECGRIIEDGIYSELHYPQIIFELNNQKEAAMQTLILQGSNYRLNTNLGTLTENTSFKEISELFSNSENELIIRNNEDDKILIIPDGEDSDNEIHLHFDKNDLLHSLVFFVPC